MGLRCLLLTRDAALLEIVRANFAVAHVELEMRTDSGTAMELSSRRHLDGFVMDCDDVSGGKQAFLHARNSRSNKLSVIIAVVNGTTTVSAAIEAGANFVLGKPVECE